MSKPYKSVASLLILVMLGNMFLMPLQVHAQGTPTTDPVVQAFADHTDQFLQNTASALHQAIDLYNLGQTLKQNPALKDDPQILEQTLTQTLAVAEQAAIAQGNLGAALQAAETLGMTGLAATDVTTVATDLESQGFSPDVEAALIQAGLPASETTNLAQLTVAKYAYRQQVKQTGLQPETRTLLADLGLTTPEIDQIEHDIGQHGVANTALPDRLAQAKAMQAELSMLRTNALMSAVRLVNQQVFVDFEAGNIGRDLSDDELKILAQDELRLLLHLTYLDDLWGANPDPNEGEGQWLFIERYSRQTADRLETLIQTTQNIGLSVDLMVVRQIHGAALVALSGDALSAKSKLDSQRDALISLLGDQADQVASQHAPVWWPAVTALAHWQQPNAIALKDWPQPAPETAVVQAVQTAIGVRVKGLAAPIYIGAVIESDETNNQTRALLSASPLSPTTEDQLAEYLLNYMKNNPDLWRFIIGVLTGESDNMGTMIASFVLGFLPIIGTLQDLVSVFTETNIFWRALAIISFSFGLISDVGLVAAIFTGGVTLLVAAPAEVVQTSARVLRTIDTLMKPQALDALTLITEAQLVDALKVALDLVLTLTWQAAQAIGASLADLLTQGLGAVKTALRNKLAPTIQSFQGLLTWVKTRPTYIKEILVLTITHGGKLAGRLIDRSTDALTYSYDSLKAIAALGDELGDVVADLSDEAVEGLGAVVDSFGSQKTRELFSSCFLAAQANVQPLLGKVRGLASPLFDLSKLCDEALNAYNELKSDPDLKRGIEIYADHAPDYIDLILRLYKQEAVDRASVEELLRAVSDIPPRNINGHVLTNFQKILTAFTLNEKAIKSLPYNVMDETDGVFYPRFDEYLAHSSYWDTIDKDTKLPKLEAMNIKANNGLDISGDIANIVGEYRERRYLELIYKDWGRKRVFDHMDIDPRTVDPLVDGQVRAFDRSRFDTITREGDVYYIGEVKDAGLRFGTLETGLKRQKINPISVGDINLLIFMGENQIPHFDLETFNASMDLILPSDQIDDVNKAILSGNGVYEIFVGGGHPPILLGTDKNTFKRIEKAIIELEEHTVEIRVDVYFDAEY